MWCCDMKLWLVRTSGAWVLYAVAAAVLFAVAAWACIAAVIGGVLWGAFFLVREWRRAAPGPPRRSGMAESTLPQTDDYVPGTLTLRAHAHDRRR